jgi:hypothetical protein
MWLACQIQQWEVESTQAILTHKFISGHTHMHSCEIWTCYLGFNSCEIWSFYLGFNLISLFLKKTKLRLWKLKHGIRGTWFWRWPQEKQLSHGRLNFSYNIHDKSPSFLCLSGNWLSQRLATNYKSSEVHLLPFSIEWKHKPLMFFVISVPGSMELGLILPHTLVPLWLPDSIMLSWVFAVLGPFTIAFPILVWCSDLVQCGVNRSRQ